MVSHLRIDCVRAEPAPPRSQRTEEIRRRFGLAQGGGQGAESGHVSPRRVLEPIFLPYGPGRIVALAGPSGSGKSTTLRQIHADLPGARWMEAEPTAPRAAVVDTVAPHRPLREALSLLAACGLAEAPLWLRRGHELSTGQQWRAQLARALGQQIGPSNGGVLLCDEFCSQLHRRAAKAVAYNLRKLVMRRLLCLVVAVSNEDVLPDLQPDTVIRLRPGGGHELTNRVPARRPISFHRRLHIERGAKSAYQRFAEMHYRPTDELGFVDQVFVLREGSHGDLLGVVVYAHGPIELSLRNRATGGRFRRRPDLLNKNVRMLRRLVIHPDVRGCGLGHMLVRKTMPHVGTPFVECLAAMGEVNPVFERAGMQRVGACPMPARQARVLAELKNLGVDPAARDFTVQVCRRPRVRAVVARYVGQWYQATTGAGAARLNGQTPHDLARILQSLVASRPVYYLWRKQAA